MLLREAGIGPCRVIFTDDVRAEAPIPKRAFADTLCSDVIEFRFAPEARCIPYDCRQGVMMHEIGHVLADKALGPNHTEDDADRVAVDLFGVEITYDTSWPGKGLQRVRRR